MSIISAPPIKEIEIGGAKYPINTDFRVWIEISEIIADEGLNMVDKCARLLSLCYIRLPPTLDVAMEKMLVFYSGEQKTKEVKSGASFAPIYSFKEDAELIFGAFYECYGINLAEEKLHFHQFRALLTSLPGETRFCKVMEYRGMDLSKIKDKEQRIFYKNMKRLFALKDTRSEEEIEREMVENLSNLF